MEREDGDGAGLSDRAERKCAQLIEGARSVMLAKGLDGASVDDIAREAGMSKATMYRYFPDKAALFAAVMRRDCAKQSDMMYCTARGDRTLEPVLLDLARRFIEYKQTDFARGVFRSAVAESGRHPEIGRGFYNSHMEQGRLAMTPVLEAAMARGELRCDNIELAAHRFFALCQAELFFKGLFGIVPKYSQADIDAHAAGVVEAFMRIYRPG